MLDSVRAVETPEGVTLDLVPAGPVARAYAWLIDFLVRVGIYILSGMILSFFGMFGLGVFLIMAFLLEWLYPVVFEVLWKGQTLGKRALGLRVLMSDGRPVTWSASLMRSIGMFADLIIPPYLPGLLCMLMDKDFRRVGDLMAGTVVVHAEKESKPYRGTQALVEAQASPVVLSLIEQRAIVAFADRLPGLTQERAEELAGHLEQLTGLRGPAAVHRLQGMAAAIVGRR